MANSERRGAYSAGAYKKKRVCDILLHYIYRLWAKLLRHRRAPYRRNTIFDFNIVLKKYIRSIVEDDIVDAAAPRGAIMPDNRTFVKYVVRRLDHAL